MAVLWEFDVARASNVVDGRVQAFTFNDTGGVASTDGGVGYEIVAGSPGSLVASGTAAYEVTSAQAPLPDAGTMTAMVALPPELATQGEPDWALIDGSDLYMQVGTDYNVTPYAMGLRVNFGSVYRGFLPIADQLDGEWHIYTMTWDKTAGLLRVYVDGVVVHTQDTLTGTYPMNFGWYVYARALAGNGVSMVPSPRMAFARLENTFLADAQAATHYQADRTAYDAAPSLVVPTAPVLNWTAVQTGGSPVSHYLVRYSQGGVITDVELAPDVLNYTLPLGYTGNAWVVAVNDVGQSAPAEVTI